MCVLGIAIFPCYFCSWKANLYVTHWQQRIYHCLGCPGQLQQKYQFVPIFLISFILSSSGSWIKFVSSVTKISTSNQCISLHWHSHSEASHLQWNVNFTLLHPMVSLSSLEQSFCGQSSATKCQHYTFTSNGIAQFIGTVTVSVIGNNKISSLDSWFQMLPSLCPSSKLSSCRQRKWPKFRERKLQRELPMIKTKAQKLTNLYVKYVGRLFPHMWGFWKNVRQFSPHLHFFFLKWRLVHAV